MRQIDRHGPKPSPV